MSWKKGDVIERWFWDFTGVLGGQATRGEWVQVIVEGYEFIPEFGSVLQTSHDMCLEESKFTREVGEDKDPPKIDVFL